MLLVAGSRPEVARLAPVATAFDDADRIRAVTVATGADPMAVHEAFEALGVPADVTQLLREPIEPQSGRGRRRCCMTRLDELLVDLDPSAIMVYGGGMTAAIAAQVAFWRQIPVVHLQAGVATRRPALPVPAGGQPAGHRPAGLAVPHHRWRGAGQPDRARTRSRSATPWPPTRSRRTCASPGWCAGCGPAGRGWCWSALDRPDSLGVLAGLPDLLDREPDIEIVAFGELAAHGAAHPLRASTTGPPSSATCRSPSCSAGRGEHRARLRRPRAGQPTHPGSAPPRCSSTARTSRSRATRSAASSARP